MSRPPADRVRVRVLGPLQVVVDGEDLALGGPKQRTVLAVLALESNRVVSVERLVTALWGDEPPTRAVATLQVHVSNLRRALDPAADALGREQVLVTRPPGYVLELPDGCHDLATVERLVAEARDAVHRGALADAAERYADAVAMWRGEALADLLDEPYVATLVTRLHELRAGLDEERLDVGLAMGRHHDLLPELHRLVDEDPLNERRRALLMVGLFRAGRQVQALDVYRDVRRRLGDELGLEPSRELQDLEGRILRQDPGLALSGSDMPTGEVATVLRSSLVAPNASVEVAGQRIELTGVVTTIGRRAGQDIRLDDERASRAHAEIRRVGDRSLLVDNGSSNGTFVNGERIHERLLGADDVIEIGSTTLIYRRDP